MKTLLLLFAMVLGAGLEAATPTNTPFLTPTPTFTRTPTEVLTAVQPWTVAKVPVYAGGPKANQILPLPVFIATTLITPTSLPTNTPVPTGTPPNTATPVPTATPIGTLVVDVRLSVLGTHVVPMLTAVANISTYMQASFGSLTFSASGYIPVSSVVQQATTTAFLVDLSVSANTTAGPFYFGLSCTDTAATVWWHAGTLSVVPATNDAYAAYLGGNLKIYEIPFQAGTRISIILPPGSTARNVGWGVYKH